MEFSEKKSSVTKLSLRGKKVEVKKLFYQDLSEVQHLDLGENELYSWIDIENCVCLKELYLDNNNLTYIPRSIGNLRSLRKLDLSNNDLSGYGFGTKSLLPIEIGMLESLEELNLSNNRVCYGFFNEIKGKLESLRCLINLKNNKTGGYYHENWIQNKLPNCEIIF